MNGSTIRPINHSEVWLLKVSFESFFFSKSKSNTRIALSIIEHVKRNTKRSPCDERPDFSFTVCLQQAVEAQVGCSLPWNSNKKMGNCTSLQEFESYETIYYNIDDENPRKLGNKFGCKIPCKYREYVLEEESHVDDAYERNGGKTFWITLSTTEIHVKQEQQIYEATSLVGDIGGSLGLFLGFSMLMVWDWFLKVVEFVKYQVIR